MLNEDIKEHFKQLCVAANHTLTRSEYRKLNDIPEYSSSKIEALWGTWKSFIQDVSSTINLNRYNITKEIKKNIGSVVITSVIDGSKIDYDCLNTLLAYCKEEKCQLHILWGKAINSNAHFSKYDYDLLKKYLVTHLDLEKDKKCKAMDLLIPATSKNPLQNLDKLSKGLNTIIVGSPKQYLETLPHDNNAEFKLALSTGTISLPCYRSNVSGQLDAQNHTLGAIRLEWDNIKQRYLTRQLQYDEEGYIYDVTNTAYSCEGAIMGGELTSCVVLGDLHAPETDNEALNATIKMLKKLQPDTVMIHDWMSYQSINHYEEHRALSKVLNLTEETKDLRTELDCSIKIINRLAKSCPNTIFYIVHSNHDEFLTKWLNEGEFVNGNPANRVIGCELFANIAQGKPIFSEELFNKNIKFLDPETSWEVEGYEIAKHGDIGIAGARGNTNAYVKTYNKSITGHTHSPKIKESGVVVGTLSKLKLSYNKTSISNWAHANCVLYKNGTFQLIFV